MNEKSRIFVSHSQKDAVFSRDYVNLLRASGFDVWYDEHNLGPGMIRSEIDRQLQEREVFIVILSPDAIASPWVSREIDGALDLLQEGQMRLFIPVVATACVVPATLRGYKRIAAANGGPVSADVAVTRTLALLTAYGSDDDLAEDQGSPLLIYRNHNSRLSAVAWSPTGRHLASVSDTEVHVWDSLTGEVQVIHHHHNSEGFMGQSFMGPIAWSPDGNHIASSEYTKERTSVFSGSVYIWDAQTGNNLVTYTGHESPVRGIAWSPDGRYIATASGGDGVLSVGDCSVQIWSSVDGRQIFTNRGGGQKLAVAWSPDGRRIASDGGDKTVRVWDPMNGTVFFTYKGHNTAYSGIFTVAWSPDGRRIASAASDKTVQVWDAGDGSNRLVLHNSQWCDSASWSPDGRKIISSYPVQIWDAHDGTCLGTSRGYMGVWSPDGQHIALIGEDRTAVEIWPSL